jgi:hypothetical protein
VGLAEAQIGEGTLERVAPPTITMSLLPVSNSLTASYKAAKDEAQAASTA